MHAYTFFYQIHSFTSISFFPRLPYCYISQFRVPLSFYLLFYFYIPTRISLPFSPSNFSLPPLLFSTLIHSSSVSLQIKAGLPCISASHGISSCSESRHFFFKDWMRQSGKRNGPQMQGTESETNPAFIVRSITRRPNCSVVTYMQRL